MVVLNRHDFFCAPPTMRASPAVLLTPLESAVPSCIPISIQSTPVNPLESALTSYSQPTENTATLSSLESALTHISPASSLESALTKTPGVGVAGSRALPENSLENVAVRASLSKKELGQAGMPVPQMESGFTSGDSPPDGERGCQGLAGRIICG